MSDRVIPPLETARRVRQMIGREDQLATIRDALHNDPEDRAFRILLVQGDGGWGKSMLLESVHDATHPSDDHDEATPRWELNGTIVADIVDLSDLQLHDRQQFITALYNAVKSQVPVFGFHRYESAHDELWVRRGYGQQFQTIRESEEQIGQAFLGDLALLTRQQRVAFIIDTVEQLDKVTPHWIAQQEKRTATAAPWLRSEDIRNRTFYWLTTDLIRYANLSNVTLILAGREKEAAAFFEDVRVEAEKARGVDDRKVEVSAPLQVRRLEYDQTPKLFTQLAEDWESLATADKPYATRIAANYRRIVANENLCRLLWFLTAGNPARLMLYAQLYIELNDIPTPLKLTLRQAIAKAGGGEKLSDLKAGEGEADGVADLMAVARDLLDNPTPSLRQMQWAVEDSLLPKLVGALGDTRANVLLALARTQRGLTREQLHYALDCQGESPDDFIPDQRRLKELDEAMKQIADFYLSKRHRPNTPSSDGRQPPFRLALQEDFYDIFAGHLSWMKEGAPQAAPGLAAGPRGGAAVNLRREGERLERQQLYRRLADWADFQVRQERDKKRGILHRDEEKLERRIDLTDPKSFQFLELTYGEQRQRLAVDEAIAAAEIERMVFLLLLDPDHNLNSEYLNLDDDRPRGGEQALDFWAQAEMRRILFDDKLMAFADFRPRARAKLRGETALQVLRRFADQEDVVRWIKRFVLRGDLDRAIKFGGAMEEVIKALPKDSDAAAHEHYSWNHSVAWAERALWTNYARVLRSEGTDAAVQEIEEAVRRLHELHVKPTTTKLRGEGLHAEYGFAATKKTPEHPAAIRVRRLLSHAYSCLGYGYRVQGRLKKAVESYGQALTFVRDDVGQMMAHRAAVLNQLSRVLSDLGWDSSPVCLDGLSIRRELVEEVPLAQSYNTLAFIFDDMGRYEDAPLLSARAMAYSRRAGDKRQLAFSLRQMAESLRHMAMRQQASQRAGATPARLYAAAYTLLLEAEGLFEHPGNHGHEGANESRDTADVGRGIEEPSRLVEVLIERGSLYRDMLAFPQDGWSLDRVDRSRVNTREYHRDALFHLQKAEELAANQSEHFIWDIRINRARVHYYLNEVAAAEAELDKVLPLSQVREYLKQKPAGPDPDMYRYLSTAQMIRGWIAVSRFRERVKYHNEQHTVAPGAGAYWDEQAKNRRRDAHKALAADEEAQAYMDRVAEAYAVGLEFARRFSPRSRSLALLEGDLYDRLRSSNQTELEMFGQSLTALPRRLPELSNLENLRVLLHDFLGFPDKAAGRRKRS